MSTGTSTGTGSLSRRLSHALALQSVVVLGAVCVVVYTATALTLASRQDATLVDERAMVRHIVAKSSQARDGGDLELMLRDFLIGHDEMGLVFRSETGRPFAAGVLPDQPGVRLKRIDFDVDLQGPGQAVSRATMFLDTSNDDQLLHRLAWTLVASAATGVLIATSVGLWTVRRSVAPLHSLVRQLGQLRPDRLDLRLDGSLQPDELQPLVVQFNEILKRLDEAHRQLESFNADVAHELNTPLAMLISSSQLGLKKGRTQEELRLVLSNNLVDLDRMAGIVRDMLFLAKADRGGQVASREVYNLRQLAQDVIEFHDAALQDAALRAYVDGEAELGVEAGLIRRALSNLLSNAQRYADYGSCILVSITWVSTNQVELFVHNQGRPIPPSKLSRVFERYYRGEPSKPSRDVNHGLGLTIVEAIARMHGGTAFARSGDGWTQVGMTLPVDNAAGR